MIVNNLRYILRSFKWGYQRIRYGFSDRDAWNGDMFLAAQVAGILKWHVNKGHGVSIAYLQNNYECTELELEAAIAVRDAEYLYYAEIFEEYSRNSIAYNEEWKNECGGILDSEMNDALQWLAEHFKEFWD